MPSASVTALPYTGPDTVTWIPAMGKPVSASVIPPEIEPSSSWALTLEACPTTKSRRAKTASARGMVYLLHASHITRGPVMTRGVRRGGRRGRSPIGRVGVADFGGLLSVTVTESSEHGVAGGGAVGSSLIRSLRPSSTMLE